MDSFVVPRLGDGKRFDFYFSFHLDNKLLVFTGKMNGLETQFAYDTDVNIGLTAKASPQAGSKSKAKNSN